MEAALFARPGLSYVDTVRLVEFLILLLEAHAQTLQRLAALYGEDVFLEILESAGEEPEAAPSQSKVNPIWFGKSNVRGVQGAASAYAELEAAVHDLKLPAMLEFHLWAYPHYRAFIESPLDLNSTIQGTGPETAAALVEEAVSQAQVWVKKLHIPPEFSRQTESAAQLPWIRFRTTVLRRVGKRPMGTISG